MDRLNLDALKVLALLSAIGAWCVIVFGGFTTATGSGLGCSQAILCGDAPLGAGPALVETLHRVVAWTEGFLILAMFILVARQYREWKAVWRWTSLALVLIIAQSLLGIVSVTIGIAQTQGDLQGYPGIYAVLVTMHLGLASAFLGVAVWNAATIFQGPPEEVAFGRGSTVEDAGSTDAASPPSAPSGR